MLSIPPRNLIEPTWCSVQTMCGIVAYLGKNNQAPQIVFAGLQALEYRGYDSWGVAVLEPKLRLIKRVGKISRFTNPKRLGTGSTALGHTRWATHGAVNKKNTHPHLSSSQRLVVVHNGIVENFHPLKEELEGLGFSFSTATDTEVIANLVEYLLQQGLSFEQALCQAAVKMTGRNAFVIFDRQERILAGVRNGSPLILGLGQNEFFLASDPNPFLAFTKKAVLLDNDELILIDRDSYKIISTKTKQRIHKQIRRLGQGPLSTHKGKYTHFYLKEVFEQPETLSHSLSQNQPQVKRVVTMVKQASQVYLTGAGTAGRVAMIGSYLLTKIAGVRSFAIVSSEFPTFAPLLNHHDILIAVSQSGETADTLEAIAGARQQGCQVVSIVNAPLSSMVRESDEVILMKVGVERAVASTKATTAPLALLTLIAFGSAGKSNAGMKLLTRVAQATGQILGNKSIERIKSLARRLRQAEHLYIIGRGLSYPLALEGAIKLQELPSIHAEGIAGAELKHYALTLIAKGTPCLVLAPKDKTYPLILSNAAEIAARGGRIIGISPAPHPIFADYLPVPDLGEFGSPILSLVPMQLLAYYLTLERGYDPDYCRNLAKSVTVR